MKLPAGPIVMQPRYIAWSPSGDRRLEGFNFGVVPRGCGWGKKIGCAVKVASAAAICYASLLRQEL